MLKFSITVNKVVMFSRIYNLSKISGVLTNSYMYFAMGAAAKILSGVKLTKSKTLAPSKVGYKINQYCTWKNLN